MSESILDATFLRKLERLALAAKRPFTGQMKGEKRSLRRGASVEFADYRDYNPGDDLRHVDWNAAARLDRLFIKLFVEEEDLYLALLIDTSASMGFGEPSKLTAAARLAAALGYIGLVNYDRVGVSAFAGGHIENLRAQRGRPGVRPLFAFLENLQADGETALHDNLRIVAARAKSKGVAVVISDFLDPHWRDGVKPLLARGFQLALVHMLDREELEPSLTGDLRIIDSETGEAKEMSVSPSLLARYRATAEAFCAEVEANARQYGADYVRITTDVPIDELLFRRFREIGLLH